MANTSTLGDKKPILKYYAGVGMKADFYAGLQKQLDELKTEGLYKSERVITSQQQADIKVNTRVKKY